MSEHKILEAISRGMDQLPRVSFDKIADPLVQRMAAHDEVTRQNGKVIRWPVMAGIMSCAAAVMLVFGGWLFQYRMVDSVISLDINPGFDITLNRKNQVLAVIGANSQAQELLGESHRGQSLDHTLAAISKSLTGNGYVNGTQSTILLSVGGRDSRRTEELQELASDEILLSLYKEGVTPNLFIQEFEKGREASETARELGITQGKMQLIRTMQDQETSFDTGELAQLNVEELMELAQQHNLDLPIQRVSIGGEGLFPQPDNIDNAAEESRGDLTANSSETWESGLTEHEISLEQEQSVSTSKAPSAPPQSSASAYFPSETEWSSGSDGSDRVERERRRDEHEDEDEDEEDEDEDWDDDDWDDENT